MQKTLVFRVKTKLLAFICTVSLCVDVSLGSPPAILKTGPLVSAAVSPDGKTVAASTLLELKDQEKLVGQVQLIDTHSRKLERTISIDSPYPVICQTVFFPDGKTLAVGLYDTTVRFLDLDTEKEVGKVTWHENIVAQLKVSPDGRSIAMLGVARGLRIYDVKNHKDLFALPSCTGCSIAFSQSGKYFALGTEEHVAVYLTENWKMVKELPQPHATALSFLPQQHVLLLFAQENKGMERLLSWNFKRNTQKTIFKIPYSIPRLGHPTSMNATAFSYNGRMLAGANKTANGKDSLRVWDTVSGRVLINQLMPKGQVGQVMIFSKNHKLLFTSAREDIWVQDISKLHGELKGKEN